MREVLPRLGGREPIEEPLARLAEVEGHPRDVRRDHEVLPPYRPREHRGGEILVNYGLYADQLAVPPDDWDASAARRDNDPSVAVAHEPPEDVFLDDVNGPRGGHDAAPAAPFVVHHLPAFRLLDDDLVFPRIVGADRFRRVRESGILRVDEHLGHDADDVALDLAGRELVAQRLRQDVADLRLALRAADVEGHCGDQVAGFLVLQEDVSDLRAVPVRQDDIVARLNKVREPRARRFDPSPLGRRIRGLTCGRERIPANRHNELLHPPPTRGSPALF